MKYCLIALEKNHFYIELSLPSYSNRIDCENLKLREILFEACTIYVEAEKQTVSRICFIIGGLMTGFNILWAA